MALSTNVPNRTPKDVPANVLRVHVGGEPYAELLREVANRTIADYIVSRRRRP